jgi:uncharacterized protein (DUF1778 family)
VKRKVKHTSKLYQYLEQANVLTSGTDAHILAAKREYRRIYQTEWRKRKRADNQEITVTLNPHELQTITAAAKKHRRSRTQFCTEAALAYCNQAFVVPDVFMVNSIREQLLMTYTAVQKLFEENRIKYDLGKELLQRIAGLETEVLQCLQQPKNLNKQILEEIRKNPAYIDTLKNLLKTHGG